MKIPKLSIAALLLLPLSVLAGCSLHKPSHLRLSTQAVGFNLTVEEAQNEMLLLNVIRAKDRLPMYLTAVSSLSGNVNTTLTGSLGGSYSEASGDVGTTATPAGGMSTVTNAVSKSITRGLTPSVGGSFSRNPNFTVAVLDGEKFTRGFLAPIEDHTFAYFWDQGWPPELLLYLLVQRVENGDETYVNYPPDREDFVKFAGWVMDFVAAGPRIGRGTSHTNVGPALTTDQVNRLEDLVAASKEGLALTGSKGETTWRLQKVATEFCLRYPDAPGDCSEKADLDAPQGSLRILRSGKEEKSSDGLRLVLRSPEAVLYYLGELMRVANRRPDPEVPHVCIQEELQPLFVAVPTDLCPAPLVEARSSWGDYVIPRKSENPSECKDQDGALVYPETGIDRCDSGRSMQALRLLSQLISLHRSAEELPSPALVRVIGD